MRRPFSGGIQMNYHGWTIEHHDESPPNARFYAERDGFGICAATLDGLRREIVRNSYCANCGTELLNGARRYCNAQCWMDHNGEFEL